MKQTLRDSIIIRKVATLAAATGFLFLGACATKITTKTPPPPGFAIIDAKPDPEYRKRIEGIALVSINGEKVQGTRSVIKPGLNTIRTQFTWPQVQDQQVDLRFYATPGTVYNIYYEVYPPPEKFKSTVASGIINPAIGASDFGTLVLGTMLLAPPAAVIGLVERGVHAGAEHSASATHIDLLVVAHLSLGTVRQVRAFPDGRVETKPWSAWAQMRAPDEPQ